MKSILAPFFLLAATAACSAGLAQTPSQGPAPLPGEIIYLPQLPSAESLANSAQSQGIAIVSIRQLSGEELVTYHFASGPDSLVAYRLLPSGSGIASQPGAVANAVPAPSTPAPAVAYSAAAPAYYYNTYPDYYDYSYYPWGWYGGGWGGYRIGWGGGYGFRGGFARAGSFGHGGGGHR